jgi:hypothetical protein
MGGVYEECIMTEETWANQSLRRALQNIQDEATKPLHEELERLRGRLTEIIGFCAQEGNDGEPFDTIQQLATGELQLRANVNSLPECQHDLCKNNTSVRVHSKFGYSYAKCEICMNSWKYENR